MVGAHESTVASISEWSDDKTNKMNNEYMTKIYSSKLFFRVPYSHYLPPTVAEVLVGVRYARVDDSHPAVVVFPVIAQL